MEGGSIVNFLPMIIIVGYIVLPIISYIIAKKKGRSAALWAVMVLIFPILFFVILLINPVDRVVDRKDKIRCPYCKEWVFEDAELCRFCGKALPYRMKFKNN